MAAGVSPDTSLEGDEMTEQQRAKRRDTDRARQARYRASMSPEQYQAMIQRKGDARRQRMATDPIYAEQYRATDRARWHARKSSSAG
jgi:hypothetical protein